MICCSKQPIDKCEIRFLFHWTTALHYRCTQITTAPLYTVADYSLAERYHSDSILVSSEDLCRLEWMCSSKDVNYLNAKWTTASLFYGLLTFGRWHKEVLTLQSDFLGAVNGWGIKNASGRLKAEEKLFCEAYLKYISQKRCKQSKQHKSFLRCSLNGRAPWIHWHKVEGNRSPFCDKMQMSSQVQKMLGTVLPWTSLLDI